MAASGRGCGGMAGAIWLLASAAAAAAAATGSSPLAGHADAETVVIVTRDADGSPRETTIWLVVVDGRAFVRTGSSRWGSNAEREPRVAVRVGEKRFPLLARPVEDAELRRRVEEAFREKYGLTDWLIGLFRGDHPRIFELLPRDPER